MFKIAAVLGATRAAVSGGQSLQAQPVPAAGRAFGQIRDGVKDNEMAKRFLRAGAAAILFVFFLAKAPPCHAEGDQPGKKQWILSALALVASNALDVHSSLGRDEMNPLLRSPNGTFNSRRAILIKSAATGGALLVQALLIKKNPDRKLYKPFAITNAVVAGVTAGTAFRNYNVPPAPVEQPSYLLRE